MMLSVIISGGGWRHRQQQQQQQQQQQRRHTAPTIYKCSLWCWLLLLQKDDQITTSLHQSKLVSQTVPEIVSCCLTSTLHKLRNEFTHRNETRILRCVRLACLVLYLKQHIVLNWKTLKLTINIVRYDYKVKIKSSRKRFLAVQVPTGKQHAEYQESIFSCTTKYKSAIEKEIN